MAAHRYWRLSNILLPTASPRLEVSGIELYEYNDLPTNDEAIVTSSDIPTEPLANLTDGDLTTRCYWGANTVQTVGFFIQWDFGSGNDKNILKVRQAGFNDAASYMQSFNVEFSDNGSDWTSLRTLIALTYPGNNTWSDYYPLVRGLLSGVTRINGTPSKCTVRAYRRNDGILSGDVQSDSDTGQYIINGLTIGTEYDLLCYDGVGICPQASGPLQVVEDNTFVEPYSIELLFNEANGSTTFTDSSPFARPITTFGDAQTSDLQARSGTTSLLLDADNDDHLSFPHQDGYISARTDFTVECWIYRLSDTTRDMIMSKYDNFRFDAVVFQLRADNLLYMSIGSDGIYQECSSTNTVPTNQWVHVAATKKGNTVRVFINGRLEGILTIFGSPIDSTSPVFIGHDFRAPDRNFHGHIDDFKWTQGHAHYTTDFTPS